MFNSGLPKIPQSVITDTFATDYERNFLNNLNEREIKLQEEMTAFKPAEDKQKEEIKGNVLKDRLNQMLKVYGY